MTKNKRFSPAKIKVCPKGLHIFAFCILTFAFSFQSLAPDPSPLTPNVIVHKDLRLYKELYICRDTFTDVMSALQIHPFLTNKANFQKSQVNVNRVITREYEQMDTWSIGKNKANSKPIQSQFKPNTKPKQNQFKPKQTQSHRLKKSAEAVKAQTKVEIENITSACRRALAKLENINKTINKLLDNITETNRDHADRRLNELTTQKQQIEVRLEELERLSLSQAEIDTIVNEGMQFLAGLEFTLHNSLPQEKLTAIRQCVEKIRINKPAGAVTLAMRTVPIDNLPATQKLRIIV